MSDFDPFSLNEGEKNNEMPVFGSFDTKDDFQTKPSDVKSENSNKENKKLDDFGSFAPFDSNPPNNGFENTGFPTFDSFDSGPKEMKSDIKMPVFGSFETQPNEKENEPLPKSKPPTFDSDSDDHDFHSINDDDDEKEAEPPYASFGKSISAISSIAQEEEEKKEKEEQQDLKFPSFGSFPEFEGNKTENEKPEPTILNSNENKQKDIPASFPQFEPFSISSQETKPKKDSPQNVAPKRQQQEKFSMAASLASVKSLLKPMPGPQPALDLSIEHIKVNIPPPKPFKETALANELSNYCLKIFNHPYVFTD